MDRGSTFQRKACSCSPVPSSDLSSGVIGQFPKQHSPDKRTGPDSVFEITAYELQGRNTGSAYMASRSEDQTMREAISDRTGWRARTEGVCTLDEQTGDEGVEIPIEIVVDESKLKALMKEALVEVLEDRKEVIYEILSEVIQDIALAQAIKERETTEAVSKQEILDILQDHA
jgi:hypothetical protein